MKSKRNAKRVYQAIGDIDADLLYDARAYRAPKIRPYLRYAVAAAVVLAVLSAALILSAANAVKSVFTIDTNYGVTLELNADDKVVGAASAASLYEVPAEKCRGLSAQEAVTKLTQVMRERGGLSNNTNTVLIGSDKDNENISGTFDTAEYCVINVADHKSDAAQKLAQKRHITAGKAALLLSLSDAEKSFGEDRLFRLSANDIALLMQDRRIIPDAITLSGEPRDGGYLSKDEVREIASKTAGFIPDKTECVLDTDGFKLIYTVMLYSGDKGAAYIINASTGAIQNEFHGSAEELKESLDKTREEYGRTSGNTPPTQMTPAAAPVSADPITTSPSQTPADENTPLQPSEKSAPTETPAAAATEAPAATEKPIVVTPTESQEAPYPTTQFISAYPGFDADCISLTGHVGGNREYYYADPTYNEHNPNAALIRDHEELYRFWDDYPQYRSEKYDARYSDEFFRDHALVYVTATEYYDNSYVHYWYSYIKGDVLYIWDRDLQLELPFDDCERFDTPLSVTFRLELDRNLSDIKKVRIIQPKGDDLENLKEYIELEPRIKPAG